MNVIEIGNNYHDRLCMSCLTMENQTCGCCENIVDYTTSIEHDSQDFSKDKSVCIDCYTDIVKYWKENKPRKIPPI